MGAIEDALTIITQENAQLRHELDTIRATMLVNWGPDGRAIKDLVTDKMDTFQMVYTVMSVYEEFRKRYCSRTGETPL